MKINTQAASQYRAARQQNYQFAYHAVPQFLFRSDFASTIPMAHPHGFDYFESLWSKMAIAFPEEHVVQEGGITTRAYQISASTYALLVVMPAADYSLEVSRLVIVFRPGVEYFLVGNGIEGPSPATLRRVHPLGNDRCGNVFDLEDASILKTICTILELEPDIRPAEVEEFRRISALVPHSEIPPEDLRFNNVWEVGIAYSSSENWRLSRAFFRC